MIINFRARPEIEEFASITQNPIFNAFVQGRGYGTCQWLCASRRHEFSE